MPNEPPVLDDWDNYEFAEESIDRSSQRLVVRDVSLAVRPMEYAAVRFDVRTSPEEPRSMKLTTNEVHKHLLDQDQTHDMLLHGKGEVVHWLLFSPYDVFLEKVLSQRLKSLETGDLL